MRVALINYLNSLPYVFAIEKHRQLFEKIFIVPPSSCTELFKAGKVDLVLLPIASLVKFNAFVRLPFGIAARRKVKSVILASQKPLPAINNILLDSESITSNSLTRILCKHFWNISPAFIKDTSLPWDARVMIGDKVFTLAKQFSYVYDLAEAWFDFTQMPMVFARWIAHPDLPDEKIQDFLAVLHFAVENNLAGIQSQKILPHEDAADYIKNYIQYELNEKSLTGEQIFLSFLENLSKN